MKKYHILYNPYAGRGAAESEAKKLAETLGEIALTDMTSIGDYAQFLNELPEEDEVIVCGGDGTLNRFVNAIDGSFPARTVSYYACDSGNDFMREVKKEDEPIVALNEYVTDLPTVTVKDKEYRFINGVGYGIDGYCCEEGDRQREKSDKPVNYTSIAVKGLLFSYKPTNATVIVDGKEYRFDKVWLAPTMNGKYYGGGMIPTPEQNRKDDTLSVMIYRGGKFRSLITFPSIFKGEHVKKTKCVTVLSGKEITVRFDSPRPLQIDGETITGVTEYTARKR